MRGRCLLLVDSGLALRRRAELQRAPLGGVLGQRGLPRGYPAALSPEDACWWFSELCIPGGWTSLFAAATTERARLRRPRATALIDGDDS